MKQTKRIVHYWCEDTAQGKCLGDRIGVAILDTGIVPHPDYVNRIAAFYDVLHGKKTPYDDNGHGSHVSGIIGGDGHMSGKLYAGMAPLCHLCMIKVLDEKGDGEIRDLIRGMDWVLEHRKEYAIRIVNISIGTLPQTQNEKGERLVQAAEELWDAGIVVVTAAGNYGPKRGTITTPGISRKVITVGSSDDQFYQDRQGRKRNSYSGRGPTGECICKPDLVAPGSHIVSCSASYAKEGAKAYIQKSGTSMATPVVSGAIALLLSKYPDMSNVEVKLRLRQTCDDLGMKWERQGWGLLNVKRLLTDR